MKKIFVLSALLVILMIPGMLLAQEAAPMKMKMMHAETLELTEEQLAKMESMKLEHQIACIKLEAELETLELQMKQEMMKDEPSLKELEAFVSKMGDVRVKLQMNRIKHQLQMRKLLGPEHCKAMMHGCGDMGDCKIMMMKGDGGGCCGMGGHGGMGMGCCGMGGHGCMGMGCCGMGGHGCMGMGCCGMGGQGMSGCCSGGAHKMLGTGCMGGMKEMKGCMGGKEEGKTIERRCIKIPSGD